MIGTSNHRSPAGAGARGTVPVGESLAGIPWKLNPPVSSGDFVHFRSFKKEDIIFAEYVGFGHVLKDTREIPVVADPSISYAQLRSQDFTHDDSRVSSIFNSTWHRTLLAGFPSTTGNSVSCPFL